MDKTLEEKYLELLYAVVNKYENETRHETALRIINENQQPNCNVAQEAGKSNE